MKCAAIVPSLQYSEAIINCVTSMLEGGYDEDIYVVSPDTQNNAITSLGDKVRFVYTNTKELEAVDTLIYKGFLSFDKEYDLIVYPHSDVVFHAEWWKLLNELWDSVDKTKVWSISVPVFNQFIVTTNTDQKLGFGLDPYNPGYYSRFSPCNSFLCSSYADMVNKYGGTTHFLVDLLLFYEAMLQHKWGLLANNGCFITHSPGQDTKFFNETTPGEFANRVANAYRFWHGRFGYNLEHFVTTWCDSIVGRYINEIVDGVNSGNFDTIDHIFDEAITLLGNTDCNKCGLKKCRAFNKVYSVC